MDSRAVGAPRETSNCFSYFMIIKLVSSLKNLLEFDNIRAQCSSGKRGTCTLRSRLFMQFIKLRESKRGGGGGNFVHYNPEYSVCIRFARIERESYV